MCRAVVLQISHTCCKHQFQPNACSSCFNQYFPFLPGGENMHNYFIKSITSSRCIEDTPRYTLVHTLVHDKYSPACWVSRKLRPKSKTIPCYTADCFKSACLKFVLFKVNASGSATRLPNCHATDIAPTERLGSRLLYHLQ